jgi:hypothetical protein
MNPDLRHQRSRTEGNNFEPLESGYQDRTVGEEARFRLDGPASTGEFPHSPIEPEPTGTAVAGTAGAVAVAVGTAVASGAVVGDSEPVPLSVS